MKKLFTLTVLSLIFVAQHVVACDCLPSEGFCKTVTDPVTGMGISSFVNIYHIQVNAKDAAGMDVTVIKVFHGLDQLGDQIRIANGNGADCAMFTGNFQEDKEYIIATYSYTDSTWAVSECGTTVLNVNGGQVEGFITEGVTEVPYQDFNMFLQECTDNTNAVSEHGSYDTPGLRVINSQQAALLTFIPQNWPAASVLDVAVYGHSGAILLKKNVLLPPSGEFSMDLRDWQHGLYFIRTRYLGRDEAVKVVR